MKALKQVRKEKDAPVTELTVAVNNTINTESTTGTETVSSSTSTFITANTVESSLEEMKAYHIIPVFSRDGEPLISHADFIETTVEAARSVFASETILRPAVRLSHEVRGRVPEAKNKPTKELSEHEKTIHYERMAFVIEIPSIHDEISGNQLSLSIGGVKNYSDENLSNKKGVDEHFRVFIGYQNKVCTNMCVWSDGVIGNLRVKSLEHLFAAVKTLFESYSATSQLEAMRSLTAYSLTEKEFANIIGRCRMYQHLPTGVKNSITPLLLSDTQLNSVVKDYYRDNSFCRDADGNINLWKLYNLFTGSNKSSYIDTFLDRTVNAYVFVDDLKAALDGRMQNWFLN
jgi:hypothetical protein